MFTVKLLTHLKNVRVVGPYYKAADNNGVPGTVIPPLHEEAYMKHT